MHYKLWYLFFSLVYIYHQTLYSYTSSDAPQYSSLIVEAVMTTPEQQVAVTYVLPTDGKFGEELSSWTTLLR